MKLTYISDTPIAYTNGSYLVYRNKRRFYHKILYSMQYLLPIGGIAALMILQYKGEIFSPLSNELLGWIQLGFLAMLMVKSKWNQNIIREIRLLEGGYATQIVFQNQIKRKLFGQPLQQMYYNSILLTPRLKIQEVSPMSTQFPTTLEQFQQNAGPSFSESWLKYYANEDSYFFIPKNPQFIDKKILIEIFNGKVIKN